MKLWEKYWTGKDVFATGRSPAQGDLPTVYRIRNTENEAKAQQKCCRA
jgi:hypothetical protein